MGRSRLSLFSLCNPGLARHLFAMSTAELIFERARALPSEQQVEALRFVDFLLARRTAESEAMEWRKLLRQTQASPAVSGLTDEEIAAEVAAVRARR